MVVSRGTRGIEAYDVPVRVQGVVHRTDAAVLTLVLTPLVLTRKETTTLTLTSYIIGQEWSHSNLSSTLPTARVVWLVNGWECHT
jgi:hypothetical protein